MSVLSSIAKAFGWAALFALLAALSALVWVVLGVYSAIAFVIFPIVLIPRRIDAWRQGRLAEPGAETPEPNDEEAW